MALICSADFAESVTENKGLYVNGISQGDFPLDNGFVSAGIKEQLIQIADFAKAHGYKRIYFEAVNESKAMYRSIALQQCECLKNTDIDPLKELISVCHSENIEVIAVISPLYAGKLTEDLNKLGIFAAKSEKYYVSDENGNCYYDPTSKEVAKYVLRIAEEIAKRYDVDGELISGFGLSEELTMKINGNVNSALEEIMREIRTVTQGKKLGIEITAKDGISSMFGDYDGNYAAVFDTGVDFAVIVAEEDFSEQAEIWGAICKTGGIDWTIKIDFSGIEQAAYQKKDDYRSVFEKKETASYFGAEGSAESGYRYLLFTIDNGRTL